MELPISPTVISKAIDGTLDMLMSYVPALNRAYLDNDELVVAVSLKFRPHKSGVLAEYKINFIESRTKDGDSIVIDEKQQDLPFKVVNDD